MHQLSTLKNHSRKKDKVQRVGRGPGSNRGKTSCRGHKGAKSRSGYKRREGQEGGTLPLYRKLPYRGFSNAGFRAKRLFPIYLDRIEECFQEGDVVDLESLDAKGLLPTRRPYGVKIINTGVLKKKVTIKAQSFSKGAKEFLEKNGIPFDTVS